MITIRKRAYNKAFEYKSSINFSVDNITVYKCLFKKTLKTGNQVKDIVSLIKNISIKDKNICFNWKDPFEYNNAKLFTKCDAIYMTYITNKKRK